MMGGGRAENGLSFTALSKNIGLRPATPLKRTMGWFVRRNQHSTNLNRPVSLTSTSCGDACEARTRKRERDIPGYVNPKHGRAHLCVFHSKKN